MPPVKSRKTIDYSQALSRCASLCERSEQCTPDLLNKMSRWGVSRTNANRVIRELKRMRFVNDQRYAHAYTHDKLCFSGWGRYKIFNGLMAKRLPREIIETALENIDDDEYRDTLNRLISAQLRPLDGEMPDYTTRMKIMRSLVQKGFETAIVIEAVKSELSRLQEELEAYDNVEESEILIDD